MRVEGAKRGTDHAQALQERDSAAPRLRVWRSSCNHYGPRLRDWRSSYKHYDKQRTKQPSTTADHAQVLQERDTPAPRRCDWRSSFKRSGKQRDEAAEHNRRQAEEWEQELTDTRAEAEWLHALVGDLRDGRRSGGQDGNRAAGYS